MMEISINGVIIIMTRLEKDVYVIYFIFHYFISEFCGGKSVSIAKKINLIQILSNLSIRDTK